jgi:hypothetical protein
MQNHQKKPKRVYNSRSDAEKVSVCHFLRLPVELLVAVAGWAAHPEDILSLAYTCKHLYGLLADKKSEFLWKNARARLELIMQLEFRTSSSANQNPLAGDIVGAKWKKIPIPAPLKGQTELCLAQLIFGKKICPCCQKEHKDAPLSILLGITICKVSIYTPIPLLFYECSECLTMQDCVNDKPRGYVVNYIVFVATQTRMFQKYYDDPRRRSKSNVHRSRRTLYHIGEFFASTADSRLSSL